MLVVVFICAKIPYESFKKMLIAIKRPKQVLRRTNYRLKFLLPHLEELVISLNP